MKKYHRRGFTLIEMMIVVLVIAILALIVGLAVRNAGDRAKHSRYIRDTADITKAAVKYRNDMGKFPEKVTDLLADDSSESDDYNGPYLSRANEPKCPWCGASYEIDGAGAEDGTGEASCSTGTLVGAPGDAGLWSKHTGGTSTP